MNSRLAIACAAIALGAGAAHAQPVAGLYVGIYAGAVDRNDAQFGFDMVQAIIADGGAFEEPSSFVNGGIDAGLFNLVNAAVLALPFPDIGFADGLLSDGRLSFGKGGLATLVAGYGFGNGFRFDAEVSATRFNSAIFTETTLVDALTTGMIDVNGVWTWTDSGSATFPSSGPYPLEDLDFSYSTALQFLLVNGYYDFGTGTVLSPYLGVGAGVARVSATMIDHCTCGGASFSNSRFVPAAQAAAGVRIAIADPVTLDIGYRLKLAADPHLSVAEIDTSAAPFFAAYGMTQSGVIGVHSLQAGLTFALP